MSIPILLAAIGVTAAFAVLAYVLGMVSMGGAAGGFVVGAVIYASLGPQGFAILALFVVGGSALTRFGYMTKSRAGTAQERGGRRGAKNAAANCTVAVVCALLVAFTGLESFAAAFVASLGAAFADTAESEVGQLFGRHPRLITTFRRIPPGADGGISLPGTSAGIVAALLTAAFGYALGVFDGTFTLTVVALAAFIGTMVDSLIGALLPKIGNELTNLACTFSAALLAFFLN